MIRRKVLALFMMLSLMTVGLMAPDVNAATKTQVLLLKGTASGKTSINLKWEKVADAERYVIKGNICGKKSKTLKTVRKTTYTHKKLKKTKSYKYQVLAQKKVNGKYQTIATSPMIHVVTKGNKKYTNPKSITAGSLTISEGQTAKMRAKVTKSGKKKLLGKEHAAKIRYISSNPSIATVDKNGNVTGISGGNCTIYAIAANGAYAKGKLTVSKAESKPVEKYTITYKFDGEVPEGVEPPAEATYEVGAAVTKAETPSAEGYIFKGWQNEPEKMPAENVVVTGLWEREKITVTYVLLGAPEYDTETGDKRFPDAIEVTEKLNINSTHADLKRPYEIEEFKSAIEDTELSVFTDTLNEESMMSEYIWSTYDDPYTANAFDRWEYVNGSWQSMGPTSAYQDLYLEDVREASIDPASGDRDGNPVTFTKDVTLYVARTVGEPQE